MLFRSFQRRAQELATRGGVPVSFDRNLIDKRNPVKHTWVEGILYREIFNPKDEVILTKIWKKRHSFMLLKGDMSIMTERGNIRIRAPYQGITEVGTQRLIYAHEDCIFVTIHKTDKKEFDEDEWIAKDFAEIDKIEEQLNKEDDICQLH